MGTRGRGRLHHLYLGQVGGGGGDLARGQARGARYEDAVLFSIGVDGYFQHLVCVVTVGQFDWGPFRQERGQLDLANAQRRAFARHGALAFHDAHDGVLHVRLRGAEGVLRLDGDRRHFLDHREDVFLDLRVVPQDDAHGVGGDVRDPDEAAVGGAELFARLDGEHAFAEPVFFSQQGEDGLDGGADGDGFVGADILGQGQAGDGAYHLAHGGHACHAAGEEDAVDLRPGHLRFLHDDLADGLALFQQVAAAGLEVLARQVDLDASAVLAVDDGRAAASGKLELARDGAAVEVLVALQVQQRVLAVGLVEFLGDPVDDDVVPILAAEAVVAVAGEHADVVPLYAHDGHVEGAAAKVEDEDGLVAVQLVQAIGERGGGRFIDDL